ncbi:hypothetical protein [Arthrobacter sp. Z1-15]
MASRTETRRHIETLDPQILQKLDGDEVDLPQVRLGRICPHPGAVLHGGAGVGILSVAAIPASLLLLRMADVAVQLVESRRRHGPA